MLVRLPMWPRFPHLSACLWTRALCAHPGNFSKPVMFQDQFAHHEVKIIQSSPASNIELGQNEIFIGLCREIIPSVLV
jgi:hypothetical protein